MRFSASASKPTDPALSQSQSLLKKGVGLYCDNGIKSQGAPAPKVLVQHLDEAMRDLEHLKSAKLPPSLKEKTNHTVAKNATDVLKPAESPKNEKPASPKIPTEFPSTWSVLKKVFFGDDVDCYCLLLTLIICYYYLIFTVFKDIKRSGENKTVINIFSEDSLPPIPTTNKATEKPESERHFEELDQHQKKFEN